MTVTVYTSSDASAPTISGTSGSLTALLYACLVVGYGAKAAAGWAREYTASNKAVFRAATGRRFRLRVDDGSAQEARLSAYETMSDIDTGADQFPMNGQVSGGCYMRKSESANSNARGWLLIASDTGFYLFIDSNGSSDFGNWSGTPYMSQMYFGDFQSFKPGDTHNAILVAPETTSIYTSYIGAKTAPATTFASLISHFVPRAFTQIGNCIRMNKWSPLSFDSGTAMGGAGGGYPDPISGALLMGPMIIQENGPGNKAVQRGVMPGLYDLLHQRPANHLDTFPGSGENVGKTFIIVNSSNSSTDCRVAVDISSNW